MRRSLVFLAPLAAALGACNDPNDVACTLDIRPALTVTVRDARSDAIITAAATVFASEGSWRDSLRARGTTMVDGSPVLVTKSGADERPGTYRLDISAPGYVSRTVNGLQASAGVCHVTEVRYTARLQPES